MKNLVEFINMINENLSNDDNIEFLFTRVFPVDNKLNIDEALEVLYKCPILEEEIGKILENDNIENSTLVDAYKILNEKEDITEDAMGEDTFKYMSEEKDFDIFKVYLLEIVNYPLLSYEQVIRLFRLIENGSEEARNKVIVHNLRLPINIAKRYRGKGVSFYDLIQYGNLGLMKAVDKYDYKKGYRFSTYATWWIRQSIDRAIKDECYTVRLPVHKHDIIHKIKKFAEQYYLKYGFEPTDYILIKNGFSRENVDIYNSIKNGGFVLSLDMPIINEDGESDLTLGDRVASEIDDYGEFMNEKLLKDFKRDFNNSQLPEKDKLVLAYRYGLYDGKTRTLEEVGEIFHLTRERIRQIESRALKKLAKIKSIKSYGEEFGLVLKK